MTRGMVRGEILQEGDGGGRDRSQGRVCEGGRG